jgi:hypothetical protein
VKRPLAVHLIPAAIWRWETVRIDFANIIDTLDDMRTETDNPEVKRMLSLAITDAQTAQMWTVKAMTWQH